MNTKDRSQCPDESHLLAFCEGTLWGGERRKVEKHLSGCSDCRESLALWKKATSDGPEEVSSAELNRQQLLVHQALEQQDRQQRQPNRVKQGGLRESLLGRRRLVWAAVVLVVGALIALPLIYRAYGDSYAVRQSLNGLRVAQSPGRRLEPRLSGGLPYSAYHPTKGSSDGDDISYDSAEHKLNLDGKTSPSQEIAHQLARVQLARSERNDNEAALQSLEQLEKKGNPTPALLNDIGVALFQTHDEKSAINYFTRALNLRPGYPEALFNRALCEERIGQFRDSEDDWREYVSTQTDDWLGEAQGHLQDVHLRNPNGGS